MDFDYFFNCFQGIFNCVRLFMICTITMFIPQFTANHHHLLVNIWLSIYISSAIIFYDKVLFWQLWEVRKIVSLCHKKLIVFFILLSKILVWSLGFKWRSLFCSVVIKQQIPKVQSPFSHISFFFWFQWSEMVYIELIYGNYCHEFTIHCKFIR